MGGGEIIPSADRNDAVPNLINDRKGRLWVWVIFYTLVYFLAGIISSTFIGIPFLIIGQSIGFRNFFLPFPLRSCSFSLGESSVCWWNPEYVLMSLFTYVLLLFLFLRFIKNRELSNMRKFLFIAVFVIIPIFLSVPVRYVTEYIKQEIYWETEMAKYYEEEKNIEFTKSEVNKLQENVDFEVIAPKEMPYGLLLQNTKYYNRDRVEMYYEKNMFSVTVIQTLGDSYSLGSVEEKNQEIQEIYEQMVVSLEVQRVSGMDDQTYQSNLGRLDDEFLKKLQAYIENTFENGVYLVVYPEGDSEWRPYVYFQKGDVYFVIRLELNVNVDPSENFGEKEKLINIAIAFLDE